MEAACERVSLPLLLAASDESYGGLLGFLRRVDGYSQGAGNRGSFVKDQ